MPRAATGKIDKLRIAQVSDTTVTRLARVGEPARGDRDEAVEACEIQPADVNALPRDVRRFTLARTGRIDKVSGRISRSADFAAVKDYMATFMAGGFLAICSAGRSDV